MSEESGEIIGDAENAGLFHALMRFFHSLAADAGKDLAGATGKDAGQDAAEETRLMTLPVVPGAHFEERLLLGTTYLRTAEERAPYMKTVGEDGLMHNQDGTLFDSSDMHGLDGTPGLAHWVMDGDGNFYAFQAERWVFPHSSILAGGEAAGAGECKFLGGRLIYANDSTGHYLFPQPWTESSLGHLASQGLDVQSATVDLRGITRDELENSTVFELATRLGHSYDEALRYAALAIRGGLR
jgi:hypothetical protein